LRDSNERGERMLSFSQVEQLQQEKQQVYVKTPLFQGLAVIDYVADIKELFPVQVILQEADHDGHRLKRVALAELFLPDSIENQDEDKPQTKEEIQPLFTGADDKTRYLVESVHEHRLYRVFRGEKYIVGPTHDNSNKSFLVYGLDHTLIGRYPRDWFRVLSIYDDEKGECNPKKPKIKVYVPEAKEETAAKSSEPIRFEQLSFELDF
jgi:hypothetical protein